ncbi:hypothetical protein, partial [Candidatus Bandiella numerosa]|uniref:hypothetical protein n=1 Tax=Candidatus Bandiella numerosa TaxID=2570586 RepID=UPI001F28EA2B
LFSIRSSASLTKNDILPPLSYVLIFSFYHICFFLPIMQWSLLFLTYTNLICVIVHIISAFSIVCYICLAMPIF